MFSWFIELPSYIQALIATLWTAMLTMAGSSLIFFVRKVNKNFMDAMLGFAAGVMIAASFFSLLSPAIDMSLNLHLIPSLVLLIGFMGGGFLLFIGDKIYDRIETKNQNDKRLSKRLFMLVSSITLHNIPEGMAVGVAFGSLVYGLDGATLTSALLLAFGIGIQNFPEGSAVSFPLHREGLSKKKAFLIGSMTGVVEIIFGVIGALLVLKMRFLLPYLLAFAAGAMIYVVVSELIPESQSNKKKDLMALWTLIGFSIMMVLDTLFS